MAAEQTNVKIETNNTTKAAESQVPDWLKAELFESVLKDTVTGYKRVKNFKAFPAMAAGENYATIMLRVEIQVELQDEKTKTVSYMLKLGHDNQMYQDLMAKHNIFDIERGMYLDVVPEFEQLYRDVGADVKFGAKCYTLDVKNLNVLLEDLRPSGFKNASRLEGLDIEHTKCVLKKLAQWHAASARRVELKGKYADCYTYGFFHEDQMGIMKQMNDNMGKAFLQCAKHYQGSEIYYESLEKLCPKITEELLKGAKIDFNEFNVLNHGDCWSNNIMFQYDAFGKIKDIYFVDYQIPKYGTPAQDLLYFLLSSTKLEIKLKQFEYFIKYYHDQLIEALTLLKYSKKFPALKDIHSALYKYGVWGYFSVTFVMAVVLLDTTETANFENLVNESTEGADFKLLMFSNARFRKHAEVILPWLYNRGAMEV